jgi:nicotinamidase-related amidase
MSDPADLRRRDTLVSSPNPKGEDEMLRVSRWVLAAATAATFVAPIAARAAATIIDDWYKAKLPAPPQLKPVTLEPKTTALLVMDFTVQTCTPERRQRCADSVPKVKQFVEEARGKGALIIYSVAVPKSVPGDILKELTPAPGEQVLPPLGPDKFINSDLEKTLRDNGITTVVAMGTQAQTSVLHTGGEAALRGFKVVVPVDAMSADDLFPELYTAWHLSTAARISNQVTLTKLDMIGF